MELANKPQRFADHRNAFGFLRLAFASLVIVSHVPETAYGSIAREPLHALFGTISFGTISVYGFFVISGYLIAGSYIGSASGASYFAKRIARIYPGFIVASLVCLMIVAPIAHGDLLTGKMAVTHMVHILTLQPPDVSGVFKGTYFPVLNGSMWTISYEFRCYLMVPLLGVLGLLHRRWTVPMLAALLMGAGLLMPASLAATINTLPAHPGVWMGRVPDLLTLTAIFFSGATFYLFRHEIRLTHLGAGVAAAVLIAGLFSPIAAPIVAATAGAYLIFYAAQRGAGTVFSKINNVNDVSYGLYLYAWPIGKLIQWFVPGLGIWATTALTLVLAYVAGWVSWLVIEKPVMERVPTLLRTHKQAAQANS